MTDLEQEQIVSNIHKLNIETFKLQAETMKLLEEHKNINKRNKWFEFGVGVALLIAGAAIARIFS